MTNIQSQISRSVERFERMAWPAMYNRPVDGIPTWVDWRQGTKAEDYQSVDIWLTADTGEEIPVQIRMQPDVCWDTFTVRESEMDRLEAYCDSTRWAGKAIPLHPRYWIQGYGDPDLWRLYITSSTELWHAKRQKDQHPDRRSPYWKRSNHPFAVFCVGDIWHHAYV